ncbi:hypothetical protein [Planktothrix mougeotii]|uniref:Uncharacterized protein n=1 Tax=Planktothrix mougeotii LEGE 06226 TaxID=1828728 RepID=A0ABR9U9V5_9CYAN|nr:hypothetical protein [Planktothrix mougeotii]MBE9143233.1 hypothetical protein [Planktothrix mougeotii LEGE 06226]
MEPFITAAVALGTVLGTKALEKTGEKIGENLFEASKQALIELKPNRPDLITAIEQAPNQPLNYSEAIAALQSAAQNDPKLRQKLEILAQLGQQEPKLAPYIQESVTHLNSNPAVINNDKIADSIKNVFEGNTFKDTTFN